MKGELLRWLAQDVDEIYLMDPIFNLHAERAKEICRFIAAHNDRRIGIHAEVWAEFIDEELARLMRDANVQYLEIGLQSTDDTALATVDRRLKMQRFLDDVGHVKRHGDSRTLRLLARERGVTYADVIDAWIAWDNEHPGIESTGYRVKHFLLEFCDRRRIAADFYRGVASWEFAG